MGTTFGHEVNKVGRTSSRAEMALSGVYEIAKVLAVPVRLDTALASVLNLLSCFLDMSNGIVVLLDAAGEPELVVGPDWSESGMGRLFARLPERVFGEIVATKMPVVLGNLTKDSRFADTDLTGSCQPDRKYAFMGVPIKDRQQVIGTLTMNRDWSNAPPSYGFDEDIRFLTMTATLIGQTVHLHRVLARDRERLLAEQSRREKAIEDQRTVENHPQASGIVGDSRAIRMVLEKVRIVARTASTVLLRGESGTGKELFANAIHELSPRNKAPFIKLNCAALPESVLESELFGHEKGSFTGALAQRKGRFELADGGTLFLDEIGEISAAFQAKLLRVLQEGEFERVGGTRPIKVDVRIIAATNRNLEEAVATGAFRADLYYRIAVVPIHVPPLRDRGSDVFLLAAEFLRGFNRENGTGLSLTRDALEVLSACGFPGNVRELENCMRRTATFAHGNEIKGDDFACRNDVCMSAVLWNGSHATVPPPYVQLSEIPSKPRSAPLPPRPAVSPKPAVPPDRGDVAVEGAVPPADDRSERDRLIDAMETAGWVQAKAARILGLTPRQIGYALRKHEVPIKRF